MCGIAGIANFKGEESPRMSQLEAMCNTIIHRGPDQDGLEIKENVALGMRRLSIIDLQGGKQPIHNEDGSIRTVFNGEIYNYKELRHTLKCLGHTFLTQSDTEVIVHAYEQYGKDFPKYLNGMFAIAIHDRKQKKIILTRDHIGIKPLYYFYDHKKLVFGSEIKVLLASTKVPKSTNFNALSDFISWEYVPGHQTLFQSINKLKPAQILIIDTENPTCSPTEFWDIPEQPEHNELSFDEWEEEVNSKLKECIKRQLVSDVPLGAFLSGGVDSSLIVAAMGKSAKTFSIGFDDPSYNELKWAKKAAAHLGVDHKDTIITPDITVLFEDLMYFMDDPIGDFSIFPTYLVSKLAKENVTVVLSGDGGDELFGGYETYLANDKARQYSKLPRFLRTNVLEPYIKSLRPQSQKKGFINKAKRFAEGLDFPESLSHTRWRIFINNSLRKKLFTQDTLRQISKSPEHHIVELFKKAGSRDFLNKSLYVDVKSYLCDNILVKVDRMSMAVSLESRVPFLDRELVELAFQIPESYKVTSNKTKILLKKIAARYVPTDCVYRKKEGFSIPIKNWLGGVLRPVMEDLLSPSKIANDGIFESKMIEKLKQEHLAKSQNHSHILWALMVFQSWKQRWLEG